MAENLRYLNISEMTRLSGLSRDTVRARLRRAGVTPVDRVRNAPRYDMHRAGPAIFTPGAA